MKLPHKYKVYALAALSVLGGNTAKAQQKDDVTSVKETVVSQYTPKTDMFREDKLNTDNNTIVFVAGNEKGSFSKIEVLSAAAAYKKHYSRLVRIGDGQTNLSADEIKKQLKEVKIDKFDVCILAHGEQKPDDFYFMLSDNDKGLPSAEFFDIISQATKNPVNLHIFSHNEGALGTDKMSHLPDGSKAFACASPADILRYTKKLNDLELKDHSFETMLSVYLSSIANRHPIIIGEKGKEPVDLLNSMVHSTGQSLDNNEKDLVKKTCSTFFDDKLLDTVINKYANKGEYNMYANEVGCAMAITYLTGKANNPSNYNKLDRQAGQEETQKDVIERYKNNKMEAFKGDIKEEVIMIQRDIDNSVRQKPNIWTWYDRLRNRNK